MSNFSLSKIAGMAALILTASCTVSVFGQDTSTSSAAGTAAQDHLAIDFGQAHNYAGFGANVWLHPPHQPEQDDMMKALKMRYVRVDIQWEIPLPDLTTKTHFSVEDISELIKKHDTPLFENHIAAFAVEMKTLGI